MSLCTLVLVSSIANQKHKISVGAQKKRTIWEQFYNLHTQFVKKGRGLYHRKSSAEVMFVYVLCCHCNMHTHSNYTNAVVCWIFSELVVAEIQKKIEDAFEVFDHDRGHAVDVR